MAFEFRVQTIENPVRYTSEQLRLAFHIAERLGRGRLVLCEKPAG